MDEDDFISKTQRKKQMTDLQKLGAELVRLAPEQLARIDMPENLREAVLACKGFNCTHDFRIDRRGGAQDGLAFGHYFDICVRDHAAERTLNPGNRLIRQNATIDSSAGRLRQRCWRRRARRALRRLRWWAKPRRNWPRMSCCARARRSAPRRTACRT